MGGCVDGFARVESFGEAEERDYEGSELHVSLVIVSVWNSL